MNFLLCGKHKMWSYYVRIFTKCYLHENSKQWAFRMGNKITGPEVNGPKQPTWHTHCFPHSGLHGMLPNENKLNSACSFQKVGIIKSGPAEGFSGCMALFIKWFLMIWYWLSSQKMYYSSPLFFSVVFQQRHPIPAVNKTVLLKNIPLGSV